MGIGATTTATGANVETLSISNYTVASGTNLLVACIGGSSSRFSVPGQFAITRNGSSFTDIYVATYGNTVGFRMLYLLNPTVGNYTISATWVGGNTYGSAMSITAFSNASTPTNGARGIDITPASLTISSAVGNLVFCYSPYGSAGAGQTTVSSGSSGGYPYCASYKAGESSTTITQGAGPGSLIGVNIPISDPLPVSSNFLLFFD